MSVLGIVTKQDSYNKIQHNTTDIGTDKRLWRVAKNGVDYLFKITDDYKIAKSTDGVSWTESDAMRNATLSDITICIDRDATYLYAINSDGINFPKVYRLDILNNILTNTDISIGAFIKPLQAFVTNQGDKIVWLGNNNTLYKMDLDGTGVESVSFSSPTFTLTAENKVYCPSTTTSNMNIIDISNMTASSASIDQVNGLTHDVFSYDGYIYSSSAGGTLKAKLYKFNTDNNSYTTKDITTDYGIAYNTVKGYFPYYDLDISTMKGLLVEDNGIDRRQWWTVNLTDLSMQVWKQFSIGKEGDTTTALCDFSSATTQKVIASCANSDPSGIKRTEVFSA